MNYILIFKHLAIIIKFKSKHIVYCLRCVYLLFNTFNLGFFFKNKNQMKMNF